MPQAPTFSNLLRAGAEFFRLSAMLKAFLILSATVSGILSQEVPLKEALDIQLSDRFGSDLGAEFSDKPLVVTGQTVGSVTIFSGARVHGLSLDVTGPTPRTFRHGYTEGKSNQLLLKPGEYVTSMEVHAGAKKGKRRIFYISFLTSAGSSISGGTMTPEIKKMTAPEGLQLGGFFGFAGGEIDAIGAVWSRYQGPPVVPFSSVGTKPPAAELGITIKSAIQLSESFGGPHGTKFSDKAKVVSGQVIESLTLYAGDRVDGLELKVLSPRPVTFSHGYTGGEKVQVLRLVEGEYITSMEVHWDKKKGRTRVFYTSFGTNTGKKIAAGSQTLGKGTVTAPEGYQLGGFIGAEGNGLDKLGAIWSSVEKIAPPPTKAPSNDSADNSSTPIPYGAGTGPRKKAVLLSESYGGPHGNQFSDMPLAKSGQIITSITIRSGARSHGITLEVSDPIPETFNHGGGGGKENKLVLASGEHITSMEIHWAKKKGRTRVFYLNFRTSAGNSVSGGSPTEASEVLTAPEGYQLGGFFGREGPEIELLGAVWTSIEPVVEPTFTSSNASTDEDIVLSKDLGGPHGIAFSDVSKIVLGNKIHSLTLRSGRRLDEVSIRLMKPVQQTWMHGGGGNPAVTLTLGPDEFINSMEVHWAKHKGRTAIFYASFRTNLDNFIESGAKTSQFATETAPEGYELGGLFGRAENGIGQLGAIWVKIGAKHKMLTDVMGTAWFGDIIRNWVGPTIGVDKDSACYRKFQPFNSKKRCPLGYSNDNINCIAQCPLAYPVECGLECIPQNDDCALAILTKVSSVLSVAMNSATAGIFTTVKTMYKGTERAYLCAANVINVIRELIYFFRFVQTSAPQTDTEQMLAVAYQSSVVLADLPIAVYACMGLEPPKRLVWSGIVIAVVQSIVKQVITNGDQIIASAKNVLDLLQNATAVENSASSVTELEDFIAANTSCGYELKQLSDRVLFTVKEIRNNTPDAAPEDIRVAVSVSPLVLTDIPSVTNNCMKEMLRNKTKQAAFETRDLLRKTMEVIIEQLVETATTDMGKNVAEDQQALETANFALVVLSGLDPTGVSYMASQFVQPICGPTGFLGEIDDGNLHDALGMFTVDEAFEGSYGTWTKKGDGVVQIFFESTDKEDVTVVIHSGGDDYAEVDVAADDTVTWESTVSELQDKTLYLDRWRPGFLGLPGSGGGSLLLWIPRAADGGHLTLHARINVS